MSSRVAHADLPRTRRRLRLRIGRLRRRLDGRVHASRRHAARLLSWRTYVRLYPGYAFLGAMALGASVSAGLGGGRWARLLAARMVRRIGEGAGQKLWEELLRLWARSAPDRPAGPPGGDHARR